MAFDLAELRAWRATGRDATPFHLLLQDPAVRPAPEVLVQVPTRRGYSFVELLEWLVCAKLAEPGRSDVRWRVPKRGGATGVERILETRGWSLTRTKKDGWVELAGCPPPPGEEPSPASFEVQLAQRRVRLAADWGVFSSGHVDEGTSLLLDAALEGERVPFVVDVGTGYGPIALGLVLGGKAERAVGTETDSVALALAARNARGAGAPFDGLLEDDPDAVPPADLTVCNLPTHARRGESERLVSGLCLRARHGPVLTVVHATLEDRFVRSFGDRGVHVSIVRRRTHSVLLVESPSGSASQSRPASPANRR